MDENRKINVNVAIDHSNEAFYCDSISISQVGLNKFVIDFKQTTPRIDQLENQSRTSLVVKHKTIILDSVLVKDFMRVLKDSLERFEKTEGKIEIPKIKKTKSKKEKDYSPHVTVTDHEKYIG